MEYPKHPRRPGGARGHDWTTTDCAPDRELLSGSPAARGKQDWNLRPAQCRGARTSEWPTVGRPGGAADPNWARTSLIAVSTAVRLDPETRPRPRTIIGGEGARTSRARPRQSALAVRPLRGMANFGATRPVRRAHCVAPIGGGKVNAPTLVARTAACERRPRPGYL